MESLYAEIGERCPYKLANHLGVEYTSLDLGDVVGWYTKMGRNTYRVFINPDIDYYKQEEALYILLRHHLESKGQEQKVTRDDLATIGRIVKQVRKIDEMVANMFLKGSIFRK